MGKHQWLEKSVITTLPLIIWLFTVIYGLLEIDFADAPGRTAYGWVFALFVAPVVFAMLVAAFILNFIFLAKWYHHKKRTISQNFFLTLYAGSLIAATILGFFNLFLILVGSEALTSSNGQLYVVFISLMAVTGFFIPKTRPIKFLKTTKQAILAALSVMICFFVIIYGTAGILKVAHHTNYAAQITKNLHKHHIPGRVKVLTNYQIEEGYLVGYSIEQSNVKVYAKAVLNGKKHLKVTENSLTKYDKNQKLLLANVARSTTAKQVKQQFQQNLKQTIKKNHLTKQFQLPTKAEQGTDDYQTAIYYVNDTSPEVAKKLAKNNLASNKSERRAFGGYPKIKFKDALAKHIMLVETPVDGTPTKTAYKTLLKHFDYSNLPDGYYEFDRLDVGRPIIEIKNHHLVRQLKDDISMDVFENPKDYMTVYDSSDFYPGNEY